MCRLVCKKRCLRIKVSGKFTQVKSNLNHATYSHNDSKKGGKKSSGLFEELTLEMTVNKITGWKESLNRGEIHMRTNTTCYRSQTDKRREGYLLHISWVSEPEKKTLSGGLGYMTQACIYIYIYISKTSPFYIQILNANMRTTIVCHSYRWWFIGGSRTGVVPGSCSCAGFNYLTFSSTGLQDSCRWQALINVTLGSVMISSHDTLYSPLPCLTLSLITYLQLLLL